MTASPDAVDTGDRGTLTISEKAIEKIAGQIAMETPHILGATGGFLGIGGHHDEDSRPRVKVRLHGKMASIEVSAGVRYPTPLRATTENLRERIRSGVSSRTGVDVRHVDIDITSLVGGSTNTDRRELQ
ncbi:Asp23/Gls24 family envelope stress response protein [Arthrobacter echini]|uniref:Asp23/Gls24 family envelope stress response protein n=1 Tax=Arthrobacter echini TaxID=1529066 RepID=A0A5D0XUH4_9MICC|nr:Asp23/Gls24 family envelope stress response protein [Arthrobacter echini]TYD00473.1 Asp23/Gls24 family envelope stress response protein [Arthrobacter echini]